MVIKFVRDKVWRANKSKGWKKFDWDREGRRIPSRLNVLWGVKNICEVKLAMPKPRGLHLLWKSCRLLGQSATQCPKRCACFGDDIYRRINRRLQIELGERKHVKSKSTRHCSKIIIDFIRSVKLIFFNF